MEDDILSLASCTWKVKAAAFASGSIMYRTGSTYQSDRHHATYYKSVSFVWGKLELAWQQWSLLKGNMWLSLEVVATGSNSQIDLLNRQEIPSHFVAGKGCIHVA